MNDRLLLPNRNQLGIITVSKRKLITPEHSDPLRSDAVNMGEVVRRSLECLTTTVQANMVEED